MKSLQMGCSGSARPQSWLVVRGAGRTTLRALSVASGVSSDNPSRPPVLSLLDGRMETLCCHLLQRHRTLQMKPAAPGLCLSVPGRGESRAEAMQLAVCAQGMQALQPAQEMHARCCRSTACLQRSHFTTCSLHTREFLAEGLGADQEEED